MKTYIDLTEEEIKKIRASYYRGNSVKILAFRNDLSAHTVRQIIELNNENEINYKKQ